VLLKKEGIDVNSSDVEGRTPLSRAVEMGHVTLVQLLLEKQGVKFNSPDRGGRTPLSRAVENGHEAVVQLLLKKSGIDLSCGDSDGSTPIHWAIANENETLLKLLLVNDSFNPHAENAYHWALCWAIGKGDERVVKLLLAENMVDANFTDIHGQTPLWLAIENMQLKIATELISSGADIDYKNSECLTALSFALRRRNHDLIKFLLQQSARTNGIMAGEWRIAYGKQGTDVVQLLEGSNGKLDVRLIEGGEVRNLPIGAFSDDDTKRCLLCVISYASQHTCGADFTSVIEDTSSWPRSLLFGETNALQPNKAAIYHQEHSDGSGITVYIAALLPIKQDTTSHNSFNMSWGECRIAWTMLPLMEGRNGARWRLVDYVSMLPYGWIPDDGIDFFVQFLQHLERKWLQLCHLADEHLSQRVSKT
jgi:ankyrin repeat protein